MRTPKKTGVAIIGAGPAGLLLGHLLRAEGIGCVILERQTRNHVESRIRAGVLETVTVELMGRLGIDARMNAEGLIGRGFNLADGERMIRIDLDALIGKHVTVYGQTELTRDLIAAATERGLDIVFSATDLALHDVDSDHPSVSYVANGEAVTVEADFIIGCDGFHGPSRRAIPQAHVREFEREYPFGWLGVLADVPPCHAELIYSNSPGGLRLPRCVHQHGAGITFRCHKASASTHGLRIDCGTNWLFASTRSPNIRLRAAPHSKCRLRRCALTCWKRCGTVVFFSPEIPHTSCRRRAPRASTWQPPTCRTCRML